MDINIFFQNFKKFINDDNLEEIKLYIKDTIFKQYSIYKIDMLMEAINHGNDEITNYLLENGDIKFPYNTNKIFDLAIEKNRYDIAKLVINNVDQRIKYKKINEAILQNNINLVRILLEEIDVNKLFEFLFNKTINREIIDLILINPNLDIDYVVDYIISELKINKNYEFVINLYPKYIEILNILLNDKRLNFKEIIKYCIINKNFIFFHFLKDFHLILLQENLDELFKYFVFENDIISIKFIINLNIIPLEYILNTLKYNSYGNFKDIYIEIYNNVKQKGDIKNLILIKNYIFKNEEDFLFDIYQYNKFLFYDFIKKGNIHFDLILKFYKYDFLAELEKLKIDLTYDQFLKIIQTDFRISSQYPDYKTINNYLMQQQNKFKMNESLRNIQYNPDTKFLYSKNIQALGNALEYINFLPRHLYETLVLYSMGGQNYNYFADLNDYLRGYQIDKNKLLIIKRMAKDFSIIFQDIPPITDDIIVYRGVDGPIPDDGDEIEKGGYLSTSLTKEIAIQFANSDRHSILYKFIIKKGTKVIPMLAVVNKKEDEIILQAKDFYKCLYKKSNKPYYDYDAICCSDCSYEDLTQNSPKNYKRLRINPLLDTLDETIYHPQDNISSNLTDEDLYNQIYDSKKFPEKMFPKNYTNFGKKSKKKIKSYH